MRRILFGFFLLPALAWGQVATDLEERIRQVENSLAPSLVYGDSVVNANLLQRMKELNVPGLSIAVVRDYKIEWAKAYGWADSLEGRQAKVDTRFQAASISKSLNSLGVLKLIQDKKLDPEADINSYLRTWKFPYDTASKGKKISIYQLLSHTAGLDIHGFPGYNRSVPIPDIYSVLKGEKPANTQKVRSLFEPGTKFKYSGGGTTITQLLITDMAFMRYADYMQLEVLSPLGMTNSSYMQPPVDTTVLASGHSSDGSRVDGKFHIYPEQAAAGLWTTPTDLAKYIIECQKAMEGRSRKGFTREMMVKRMTPYIDSNAALGVFIMEKGERKYFNHNGSNEGFMCSSWGSLQGGDGVVIMTNGENTAILDELNNSVAQVYGWKGFYKPQFRKTIKLSAAEMDGLVGGYKLQTDTLYISKCGEGLCIRESAQPEPGFALLFTGTDEIRIKEVPSALFKFFRNEQGIVESLELRQNGLVIPCPRIKP